MSFLEETNADAIMEKYNQASELGQNIPPIDSLTNKKIAYNISTGKNDVLLPMDGGGYVVLAELDKDKTQEIKEYAHILKDMPFDIKDYEAAGYTLEEVEAAGMMPKPVEKTGRTEPLTRGEELLVTRSGGDLAMPREQTLREKDVQWMTENGDGELRQIFEVLGMDEFEARQLAEGIFGNYNSTQGDLGLGIADFTPMGIFYGSEEGINTYLRGRNSGDNVTAAFGALEAGLSLLEAFPVTAAGAKGLKKNIPLLREGLEEFGQALKQRLNQPGEMPTVGSMGGNIADLRKQANIQRFGYDPDDPVANVKAPTEKEPGIIAFHGSGADFNEFRLDMVNTGEGAQAYGYGLYFTDSEDIANFYRQSVGGGTGLENFAIGDLELVKSGEFRDYSPGATPFGRDKRYRRVQNLTAEDYAQASLIEDIFVNEWRLYNEIKTSGAGSRYEPKKGKELKNELLSIMNDTLKSKDPIDQPGEVEYLTDLINSVASNEKQINFDTKEYGKTYQVALQPKPDELIDYDLSLNEQSENIKKALQPFYEKYGVANTADFGTLLETVKSMRSIPDDAFSEELVKKGIKGVKYRAAGSRGASVTDDAAKQNYVIFDEKLISIMQKYGIVAPVAISAQTMVNTEE